MRLDNATPYPVNFTATFDMAGHEQVVLVTKVTLDLPAPGAPTRIAPVQMPLIEADVFGPDPGTDATVFETDFAAFKPLCDVLCHACAHAPNRQPVTEVGVGIRLGNWAKKFTAHGARIWLRGGAGYVPSARRAFTVQDIGYDQAYGGTDPDPDAPDRAATYEQNPVGLGYYPLALNREGLALAQTSGFGEDASDPNGRFAPMAYGPLGRSWLPRRSHAGTYDENWTDRRMPLLPFDFNDLYYQSAPPDQQIPYPLGGEPVEIVNLSPQGRISAQLPRLQIVVMFARKSGRITQRVANLDTVLLLPELGKMCLTYRTRITAERDIFEFASALITERTLEGATHHEARVLQASSGGRHG